MVRLLLPALALLLLGALPLAASAGEDSPTRFFEVYDKNGDGVVTPDELGADADVFKLLDRDGDGRITHEDLGTTAPKRPAKGPGQAPDAGEDGRPRGPKAGDGRGGRGGGGAGPQGRGDGMKQRLLRMDANGDGKISREEFKGPAEMFDRLDKNADGVLEGPELDAPRGRGGRGGDGQGRGGKGGPGRGGQGREGRGRPGQGAQALDAWKKRIAAMDVDGDGRVTKDEYQGRMPFERLDQNGDGFLDDKDVEAMTRRAGAGGAGGAGGRPARPSPEQMREALRKMDANGDGRITKDEYTGPIPFERLDRDGDGALTEKDMARGERGADGRGGQGGRRPGRDRAERMRQLDKDGDGKISREEFPGPDELFDRLDRNGDGVLTEADHPEGAPGEKRRKGPATKPAEGVSVPALDKDGNGKLSRNEFPGSDDEWRKIDKNGDGWITIDECAAR